MFSHLPKDLKEIVVEYVDTKELLKFLQINHDLRQFVRQNGPFSKTLREIVIFTNDPWLRNNELYTKNLQICMKTKESEYTFRDWRFDRDIQLLIYFIKKIRFCQEISIMSLSGLFYTILRKIRCFSLFAGPGFSRKQCNNGHLKILDFLPAIKNAKKWTIYQSDLVNLSFLLNKLDFGSCKRLTIGSEYSIGEQVSVKDLEKHVKIVKIDCKEIKVLNRTEIWELRNHLEKQQEEIDELKDEKIHEERLRFLAVDYLKKDESKELAKKTREALAQEKKNWKQSKRDENRSIKFKREKHQQMKRENFQRKQ